GVEAGQGKRSRRHEASTATERAGLRGGAASAAAGRGRDCRAVRWRAGGRIKGGGASLRAERRAGAAAGEPCVVVIRRDPKGSSGWTDRRRRSGVYGCCWKWWRGIVGSKTPVRG